jgi:integrase
MQILGADQEPAKPKPKFFRDARDQFLEEFFCGKSASWKRNMTNYLTICFKKLDHRRLDEIEDHEIKACLDGLRETPSQQLHAFRGLRCFMRWCVRPPQRFIKHSPMEGYPPPGKDRKKTRILNDQELKAVWLAADTYPHNVVRLIILWGTRRSETCVIERTWVIDDVLTIPGIATKNGRDHAIPLLPVAQSLLDGMPAQECYFLRSRWADSHLSPEGLSKAQKEVMERSGTSGWTLHDLRRTFRSNMARLRVTRDTCEVLINHAPKVLDEIYDRYDRLDEKHEALELYEAFVMKLIGVEYPKPVAATVSAGSAGCFAGNFSDDVMLAAKMLLAQHFAELVGDPAMLMAMMEAKQKKATTVEPNAMRGPLQPFDPDKRSNGVAGLPSDALVADKRHFLTDASNFAGTVQNAPASQG